MKLNQYKKPPVKSRDESSINGSRSRRTPDNNPFTAKLEAEPRRGSREVS